MNKIILRFYAKIEKVAGKLQLKLKNPAYYQTMLRRLRKDKDVVITIENLKSKRTLSQNSYLWGIVYPLIAETTGHTENEIHEWAKQIFLPPKIIRIKGKEIMTTKSTTELSIGEADEFIRNLRQFAMNELNCHISTPEEAGFLK